jgi:hypothetical protein
MGIVTPTVVLSAGTNSNWGATENSPRHDFGGVQFLDLQKDIASI